MTTTPTPEQSLPADSVVHWITAESYKKGCADSIIVILIDHFRNPVRIAHQQFHASMAELRHNGLISREDFVQVCATDIVACEQRVDGSIARYAIIEASITVNSSDIATASRRAAILRRATGIPTEAFFATHYDWPETLAEFAAAHGVTIVKHEARHYVSE